MARIQDLVKGLPGGGWTLVSSEPIEETQGVANPAASDPYNPDAASLPSKVNQGTGRYYVIVQDDADPPHQRALFLKGTGPAAGPTTSGGNVIRQTGVNDTVPDATDPSVKRPNPDLYTGDLNQVNWAQVGALADIPKSTPQASQALIDDKSKADAEQSRASADYSKAQADAVRAKQALDNDPQNLALQHANEEATRVLNAAQARNQDAAAVAAAADTALKQAAAPGQIALTAAQTEAQKATAAKTAATTPSEIGLTQAQTAAQLAAAAKAAEPTVLTADTVAPFIMTMNPATGKLESQPNVNQIKASEATSQLASQLGLRVAAGSMSEKDAQDLITGAVNTMNAQTSQANAQTSRMQAETAQTTEARGAAGDILANTRGNAQTGAGLLQQRAQAAQGMLNQTLGLANDSSFRSAPAGLGGQLVSGIGNWTANLMGGQSTLDSAARLVQMADPRSDMSDPASHTAVGVLTQMLDKYQQLTGAPHPAVAATQAAAQSQQNGGVVAPATAPNPAYASTGAGAVTSGYGASGGNPWGNAPNGFPAPVTSASGYNPAYASGGAGAVGAGFTAPSSGSGHTIIINA